MKRISSLVLLFVIILSLISIPYCPVHASSRVQKRVLVLITDYIGADDMVRANPHNLTALARQSSIGLINNRIKNKVPASSYMSLGTANRVATVAGSELSYNSTEAVTSLPEVFADCSVPLKAGILYQQFTGKKAPVNGVVNLYIEPAAKYAATHNPMYIPGGLGSWALSQHLTVGVLGNSDTKYAANRSAAILAMDENGQVPQGWVANDLLLSDPLSPGGFRSNHSAMLFHLDRLLKNCDIIVMDLGDTSRVELSRENCSDLVIAKQRVQAIKRNDQLLGKIIQHLDMNNTMIIVLSPNANADMVFKGNFTLTPIVVYNPESRPGYLTSPTTRRSGLVTNVDLLPTVISFLSTDKHPGSMTTITAGNNSFQTLADQVTLYQDIRNSRNPMHYVFMLLALIMLLVAFQLHIQGNERLKPYKNITVLTVLSMPLVFLFLGYTRYQLLPLLLILSAAAAWLIAKTILTITKNAESALILLTLLTGLLIIIDCFRGSPWMLISPLGSDTIAGGRFYGIGNDYMGVLVSTAVIATMLLLNRINIKPAIRVLLGIIPLSLAAFVIGAPEVGANIGGLITALVALGMFIITLTNTRVTFKRLFIIGMLAVCSVLIVAELDARFSANPSHAGKAVASLFSGGYQVFLSIIITKLGILGSTVIHSSWTIILVLTLLLLLLFRIKRPELFQSFSENHPALYQANHILAISTLALFIFNDTGVIASAIILLYMTGCILIGTDKSHSIQRGPQDS